MKRSLIACMLAVTAGCASTDWQNVLNEFQAGADAPLTEATIRDGLREALTVGIDKAVALTARQDGYFGNASIRIPLPAQFEPVENVLRPLGFGPKIDEFVLSLNRAAERAAPAARDIFVDAIVAMDIQDARAILHGTDTAATDYLRAHTSAQLAAAFRPVVERAMNEHTVTQRYQTISSRYNAVPLLENHELLNIEDYAVEKALDGLFLVLGEQEKLIRDDPAARVTTLLKRVFANKET